VLQRHELCTARRLTRRNMDKKKHLFKKLIVLCEVCLHRLFFLNNLVFLC
jgi:hypothetical protein